MNEEIAKITYRQIAHLLQEDSDVGVTLESQGDSLQFVFRTVCNGKQYGKAIACPDVGQMPLAEIERVLLVWQRQKLDVEADMAQQAY